VRSRRGLGSERSDPGHAAGWVSAKASWIMLLSQFVHIRMGKFPKFGMIEIDCRGYQLLQGIRQRLFSEMGEGFLSVMSNH
jgi:hypothetical protein